MMEMSIITMKLFPFISKDFFKKEKLLFLQKINDLANVTQIKEEHIENPDVLIATTDRIKVQATVPRVHFSAKESRKILELKLSPKNVSVYFSLKETSLKVPQSFRENVKNNFMYFKDPGGEKQNYFKFSSSFGYNCTDELGIIKKFIKKYNFFFLLI